MSFKSIDKVGFAVAGLILGGFVGYSLNSSKLDGRLSACKDMTSVLNQSIPLQLQCEIFKGDVYISSPFQPGLKVSLDGQDVVQ